MKKKNLLALSALVLSLGLTVSSCAGQPGKDGQDGQDGAPGEPGEPGTPGQDGKTYIDIIVSKVEGGTIKQDLWAVEEGKNETVTFTFVPENDSTDLVINIEVNGVVLPDVVEPNEDGELVWKLTVDENYKSVQLRAATFTNADSYGKDQIEAYYESLVEKDNQLDFTYEDATKAPEKGQWYDTSVSKVVSDEQKKVTTALAALDEDATAREKLDAVKPVVEAAKTAIDEAYSKALTETKTKAKEALDKLSTAIKSENFADADRASILTTAKGEVDAATSIQAITTLVNNVPMGDDDTVGTYDQLYSDKSTALKAVEDALDEVLKDEKALDPENSGHESLVNKLEGYVTLDTLPTEVAKEWLTKISAATTFEHYTADSSADSELSYKAGDVVMAVEGAVAVKETLQGLKDQIVENIRAKYLAEVDNAKTMTSTDQRTTAKSVINNAVDNWVDHNEDTASLTKYVDTTIDEDTPLNGGLIGYLETVVSKDIDNIPFQNERVQNAAKEAIEALTAKVKEIKDSDADYAKAIAWSEVPSTSTTHKGEHKVTNNKIGVTDYQIDNPFVIGLKEDKEGTDKGWYADSVNKDLSVDERLKTFTDKDGFPLVIETNGTVASDAAKVGSVLDLVKWEQAGKDSLDDVYEAARGAYKTAQENSTYLKDILTSTEADNAELKANWDALFTTTPDYTMVTVSNAVAGVSKAKTVLFDETTGLDPLFDEKVSEWNSSDNYYVTNVLFNETTKEPNTSVSSLAKEYDTLKKAIIGGTADSEDVEDFIDSLDDLYEADIASYKAKTLTAFNNAVLNAMDGRDPSISGQIETMGERATSMLGDATKTSSNGVSYDGLTATSVHAWYLDGLKALTEVDDTLTFPALTKDWAGSGDIGYNGTTLAEYAAHKLGQIANTQAYDKAGTEVSAWYAIKTAFTTLELTSGTVSFNLTGGDYEPETYKDEIDDLSLNATVTYSGTLGVTLTYSNLTTTGAIDDVVEDAYTLMQFTIDHKNAQFVEDSISIGEIPAEGVEVDKDLTVNNDSSLKFNSRNEQDPTVSDNFVVEGKASTMTEAIATWFNKEYERTDAKTGDHYVVFKASGLAANTEYKFGFLTMDDLFEIADPAEDNLIRTITSDANGNITLVIKVEDSAKVTGTNWFYVQPTEEGSKAVITINFQDIVLE